LPPLTFSTGQLVISGVHAILDHQNDRLQAAAAVLIAEWRDPAPAGTEAGDLPRWGDQMP
jgi:hypothetical protein